MIDGRQRVENIRTKVRIISRRQLRQFLSGEIHILPEQDFEGEVAKEFDRLHCALSSAERAT